MKANKQNSEELHSQSKEGLTNIKTICPYTFVWGIKTSTIDKQ